MKKHGKIYEAIAEDLTNLGGPMGTEEVYEKWRRLFYQPSAAKEYCEQDYKKYHRSSFKWKKDGQGWSSGDLLFIMYSVRPVKIYT